MSVRHAVWTLVVTLVLGGCLLLLAWRSDIQDRQRRTAPPCSPAQVFTTAACRAELDGTVTSLTRDRTELDVDGHHLVMDITISHDVPAVTGRPVRVTLYRGAPIRIEVDTFKFNQRDTPANDRAILIRCGLLCIAAGSLAFVRAVVLRRRNG